MMIRERTPDLSEPKVLKVRLPTDLHLQLHSLKVLTGRTISGTVEEALSAYFESRSAAANGSEGS